MTWLKAPGPPGQTTEGVGTIGLDCGHHEGERSNGKAWVSNSAGKIHVSARLKQRCLKG